MIIYGGHVTDQVTTATASFSAQSTDPKAQIITVYTYASGQVRFKPMLFRGRYLQSYNEGPMVIQSLFYDGPTPPPGTFDQFLAIPHFMQDIGTRSFLSLVKSMPSDPTANLR